jgi:hypothetical protein
VQKRKGVSKIKPPKDNENEDVADSDRMVLWVYNDDYQYFLSMTPLSEREVNKAIKDWFYKKTRLKVDLVYVQ